jgi:lipopolysaccharide biosynthesis glycosyltransferase
MGKRIHDQAAINRVLAGNWLELSPAINMPTMVRNTFVSEVCRPVVTHFLGKYKPWHGPAFSYGHPIYAEMTQFFARSPWPAFLAQHTSEAGHELRERQGRVGHDADALRGSTLAMQWPFLPRTTDYAAVVAYLRGTRFADVASGMAAINLDRIPARLSVPLPFGAGGRAA